LPKGELGYDGSYLLRAAPSASTLLGAIGAEYAKRIKTQEQMNAVEQNERILMVAACQQLKGTVWSSLLYQ
jgi:hypothetical protein